MLTIGKRSEACVLRFWVPSRCRMSSGCVEGFRHTALLLIHTWNLCVGISWYTNLTKGVFTEICLLKWMFMLVCIYSVVRSVLLRAHLWARRGLNWASFFFFFSLAVTCWWHIRCTSLCLTWLVWCHFLHARTLDVYISLSSCPVGERGRGSEHSDMINCRSLNRLH